MNQLHASIVASHSQANTDCLNLETSSGSLSAKKKYISLIKNVGFKKYDFLHN